MKWTDIYEFEGLYRVSENGDIERIGGTPKCRNSRIIATRISKNGYVIVTLSRDHTVSTRYVHQLVAWGFLGYRKVGRCKGNWQVNHKDGDKKNNHYTNLEYTTLKDNHIHAASHGLTAKGEQNGSSKLGLQDVVDIRRSDDSNAVLALKYGVGWNQIYRIRKRIDWRHV